MKKFITFTFPNGDIWGLPLAEVASHRASYYIKIDLKTTFAEEFDFIMGDDFEGVDWFRNCCNPEDFPQDKYVLLKKAPEQSFYHSIVDAVDFHIREAKGFLYESARKEIDRLREALKFYSLERTYKCWPDTSRGSGKVGGQAIQPPDIDYDQGSIARAALKEE